MKRACGDCQLCCKLLPINEKVDLLLEDGTTQEIGRFFNKPAGQRCCFQQHGKGCSIYGRRPQSCRSWSCRWLLNDDTQGLRRPDRSHYVVDMIPDFVTMQEEEDGPVQNVQVVQIWIDPDYPDAHRDPDLRAYLLRRGEEGIVGIIRYSPQDAIVIFPPTFPGTEGQWHEIRSRSTPAPAHRLADIAEALGGEIRIHLDEGP